MEAEAPTVPDDVRPPSVRLAHRVIGDPDGVTARAAAWRIADAVVAPQRVLNGLRGLPRWYRDLRAYRRLPGAEPFDWRAAFPQLHDWLATSPYDAHYFFQDVWAAQRVAERRPARHVDVGSRVDLVGFLTAITDVTFVDIRPLEARIDGLTCVTGSVLELPFESRSLESVSCLHVAEHIGLGRYGDGLDPEGTVRAIKELQRVVAPGGELLFSGPVGTPRLWFNAHRVHSPTAIAGLFDELELLEFAGSDDAGRFERRRTLAELEGQRYALGLFRLRRPDVG